MSFRDFISCEMIHVCYVPTDKPVIYSVLAIAKFCTNPKSRMSRRLIFSAFSTTLDAVDIDHRNAKGRLPRCRYRRRLVINLQTISIENLLIRS